MNNTILPKINFVGKRFGRLEVLSWLGRDQWSNNIWKCVCDCGQETEVVQLSLKHGSTKSCGCLSKEITSARTRTHGQGHKKTSLYRRWAHMTQRCNNPTDKEYKHYGARGITVCERWLKFENFMEDMGTPPKDYILDRINNNLGYYKENCRWTSYCISNNNRRNTLKVKYLDQELTLSDWCRKLNLRYNTIHYRLHVAKWTVERAFEATI